MDGIAVSSGCPGQERKYTFGEAIKLNNGGIRSALTAKDS